MSNWLVFLLGIIFGFLFGIISGRKNYESCQEQLKKLEADIQARKKKLAQTQEEIDEVEHHLEEVAEEVAEAKIVAQANVAVEEQTAPETVVRAENIEIELENGEESAAEIIEEEMTITEKTIDAGAEKGEEIATVFGDATTAKAEATTGEVTTPEMDVRGDEIIIEQVTECPQKLARIKGIGRVYEDKLYKAGIGTFWQVATTPVERLAQIFDIKDFQAVDLASIQQHARQLAEETGTIGKTWSGHEPDDMELLPGIGKVYEGRLYDAGICTWEKLAALTPAELAAIIKAPQWNQPDYDAWIAFARQRLLSQNA